MCLTGGAQARPSTLLAPTTASEAGLAPAPSCGQLFQGFLLGLTAAALPLARRMVVEKHRWLSGAEFTDLLGLCQFLPGGNIINLSVALGMKFRGPRGAFSALMGLILAPSIIVVLLGMVYDRFQNDHVQHLFAGLAAAAALLISMAVKIGLPVIKRRDWLAGVVATACFICIAVLRIPLLPTMAVLTPLSKDDDADAVGAGPDLHAAVRAGGWRQHHPAGNAAAGRRCARLDDGRRLFRAVRAGAGGAGAQSHGGHAGGLARGRLVRHAGHHPGQVRAVLDHYRDRAGIGNASRTGPGAASCRPASFP